MFVGRVPELGELERALDSARAGSGTAVLVAGEAGIGKTRLASELSRRARDIRFDVLLGRSIDLVGTELPYQPFVEALRHTVAAYAPATLHERLHGLEQDLARVFPELRGRLSEPSPSVPTDPESERYRLFEAITALLTSRP